MPVLSMFPHWPAIKMRTTAAMAAIARMILPLRPKGEGCRQPLQPSLEPLAERQGVLDPRIDIVFQMLEVGGQGSGVRIAVLAPLPQTAEDDLMELRREALRTTVMALGSS